MTSNMVASSPDVEKTARVPWRSFNFDWRVSCHNRFPALISWRQSTSHGLSEVLRVFGGVL